MGLFLQNRAGGLLVALPEGAQFTLGRSPQCDVLVRDATVSRRHCSLTVIGDVITVTDLGSHEGTFINGRRVDSGPMKAGDQLRAGTTILELIATAEGGTTAPGSSPGAEFQSVVCRKFEPTRFSFLETHGATDPALALKTAERHLATLHSVSEHLANVKDVDSLSDAVLDTLFTVTAADRAALLLKHSDDPDDPAVDLVASRSAAKIPGEFKVSRTLVADVVTKGVSTFASDAAEDERYRNGFSVIQQHIHSVMCVPLRTSERILGALYVDTVTGSGRFGEADLELMAVVGNQAGMALHRARLLEDLHRLLLDTLRALAATIDAKDGYTHRHSERVAAIAKCVAAETGLPANVQDAVGWAGLLHDVGKIAVPDSILNKPGKLTTEEFAAIKEHPGHGAAILSNIESRTITEILPGVRAHHEKWDGSGYPDGLKGEEIPLIGRLVGIADFLDALTSTRSYRTAMTIEDALRLISEGCASHFDPALVTAVMALHVRGALEPAMVLTPKA